jgi:hypothetical protein
MNEPARPNAEITALIEAHRSAERSRATARRSISLLIVGVIVIHLGLLWSALTDFRSRDFPEFLGAVGGELANISPRLVSDVQDMVNRLYPHYVHVFSQMFERDYPRMADTAHAELSKLDAYAQEKWPLIEGGIVDLTLTSEDVVREEMSNILSDDEVQRISAAYGAAIHNRFNEVLTTTLKEHVDLSREIGLNLDRMVATEPDLAQPVSMQEALGILLELAGSELQQGL